MKVANYLLILLLVTSCSNFDGNRVSSVEFDRSWELVSFVNGDGEELTLYDYEVHTLRFDEDESEFSGETACNYYGGEYRALRNGKMSIRNLSVTEALCRQPSWGEEFIDALVEVSEFNKSEGKLVLKFGEKGRLRFFERLE